MRSLVSLTSALFGIIPGTLATALPSPVDVEPTSSAFAPEARDIQIEKRFGLGDNNWPVNCSNNGGTALCCQGTFAGDLPIIFALAGLTAFPLNPNDVNCIGSKLCHY